MTSGVYKITNTQNGKCYVGSAIDLEKRKKEHLRMLNRNYHNNNYLQNAWNKYGSNSFDFLVVEKCTKEDLLLREQYWIDKENSYESGYNLRPQAANNFGMKHSRQTIKKIKESNLGLKRSKETREKMRQSKLGKKRIPHNEETKRKIGLGNRGTNSKLSPIQVVEIRKKYACGKTSQRKLAREYSVSKGAIERVVKFKSWAYLQGE